MFNKSQFLADVLAEAGSKAAIARALDLPSPRIAEIFNGTRKLSIEEGMALAEQFDVQPFAPVNAGQLKPILQACLRIPPKAGWTDTAIEQLADDLEFALGLLRKSRTIPPSQDVIDLVSHVLSEKRKPKPA